MIPFAPAIYEYKARFVDRPVRDLCHDPVLLAEALIREYETVLPASLTVGVDIYNLEIEALGGVIVDTGYWSCPELKDVPFNLDDLVLPDISGIWKNGRFGMIQDAAGRARQALGQTVPIRIAQTGPVTLAAKMVGIEPLLLSLCFEDGKALELLDYCMRVVGWWSGKIREYGFDAVIFDSMAAPPIFSPDLYRQYIFPLHCQCMELLEKSGQIDDRELVIGGDTTVIAAMLAHTGATTILCDYAAAAPAFASEISSANIRVRRNITPVAIRNPDTSGFKRYIDDLKLFRHPIAGTGILPPDLPLESLLNFRNQIEVQTIR